MISLTRRVKSLDENFEFLGIALHPEAAEAILDLQSGRLDEGLKAVRIKRFNSKQRSSARARYRHSKSKINRARRRLRKKPVFKRRQARIKKMKNNRKAGSRRRFVFTGLDVMATISESMILVNKREVTSKKDQIKALESAIILANQLVTESKVLNESYNYEYGEAEDLDHAGDKDAFEDDGEFDEFDYEEDEDEQDEDEEDEDEEDAEACKTCGRDWMESKYIVSMRTEAEDVLAGLKADKITPQDAQKVVMDIIKYLGGALKSFSEMAGELNYVGQDKPQQDAQFQVDGESEKKALVGQDQPKGQQVSVADPSKEFGKKEVGDDKLDGQKASVQANKAQLNYVGQDKPQDDNAYKVPGSSLVYSYVGKSNLKHESKQLTEAMHVYNAVVRWSNGELEGFSASALDAKSAKHRALEKAESKARHMGKLNKDNSDSGKYAALSPSEYSALTQREKKNLQDDWKLSSKSMAESVKIKTKSKLEEAMDILNSI